MTLYRAEFYTRNDEKVGEAQFLASNQSQVSAQVQASINDLHDLGITDLFCVEITII